MIMIQFLTYIYFTSTLPIFNGVLLQPEAAWQQAPTKTHCRVQIH